MPALQGCTNESSASNSCSWALPPPPFPCPISSASSLDVPALSGEMLNTCVHTCASASSLHDPPPPPASEWSSWGQASQIWCTEPPTEEGCADKCPPNFFNQDQEPSHPGSVMRITQQFIKCYLSPKSPQLCPHLGTKPQQGHEQASRWHSRAASCEQHFPQLEKKNISCAKRCVAGRFGRAEKAGDRWRHSRCWCPCKRWAVMYPPADRSYSLLLSIFS